MYGMGKMRLIFAIKTYYLMEKGIFQHKRMVGNRQKPTLSKWAKLPKTHNPEVVGSNPAPATILRGTNRYHLGKPRNHKA